MDNVKIEVAKKYVDMVERHHNESLKMTKELGCSELDDDETLETFYKVSYYNTELYQELKTANRFYEKLVNRLLKDEKK